jgi:hypothetical protein
MVMPTGIKRCKLPRQISLKAQLHCQRYKPGPHPAVRGCMSQATLGAIGLAVAATCCASLVAAQEQQNADPNHSILPLSPRKEPTGSSPRTSSRSNSRAQSPSISCREQTGPPAESAGTTVAAREAQDQRPEQAVTAPGQTVTIFQHGREH